MCEVHGDTTAGINNHSLPGVALLSTQPTNTHYIMHLTSFIFVLLTSTIAYGNPTRIEEPSIQEITDENIRKFQNYFFDDPDIEHSADDKKSTLGDYPDYSDGLADDILIHLSDEENKDRVSDEKGPTFVLSQLLFHLAQLPQ